MLQCICVHHLIISCHSLEDLLELLAGRVNSENQFRICVSRDNLLERGVAKSSQPAKDSFYWRSWSRLWCFTKGVSYRQVIKYNKSGKAVTKINLFICVIHTLLFSMLFKEMISGIEKRLFLGQRAKTPQYSNRDLDNGLFRFVML